MHLSSTRPMTKLLCAFKDCRKLVSEFKISHGHLVCVSCYVARDLVRRKNNNARNTSEKAPASA